MASVSTPLSGVCQQSAQPQLAVDNIANTCWDSGQPLSTNYSPVCIVYNSDQGIAGGAFE